MPKHRLGQWSTSDASRSNQTSNFGTIRRPTIPSTDHFGRRIASVNRLVRCCRRSSRLDAQLFAHALHIRERRFCPAKRRCNASQRQISIIYFGGMSPPISVGVQQYQRRGGTQRTLSSAHLVRMDYLIVHPHRGVMTLNSPVGVSICRNPLWPLCVLNGRCAPRLRGRNVNEPSVYCCGGRSATHMWPRVFNKE